MIADMMRTGTADYRIPKLDPVRWDAFLSGGHAPYHRRRIVSEAEKAMLSRDPMQIAAAIISMENLEVPASHDLIDHDERLIRDLEYRYCNATGERWEYAVDNPYRQLKPEPAKEEEWEIVGLPPEPPPEKTFTQAEVDQMIADREREWFAKLYGPQRKAIKLRIGSTHEWIGYFSRTILDESGRTEMTFTHSGERI